MNPHHHSADFPWTPTVPHETQRGTQDTLYTPRSRTHGCSARPTSRPWWRLLLHGLI